MSFSEHIIYALFKPTKYKELIEMPKKKFVKFVVIVMLIIGLVGYAVPAGAFVSSFGGFERLFSVKMKPFEVKDGKLNIEKPFNLSFGDYTFTVDTEDKFVAKSKLDHDGINIAIGSEYLVLCLVSEDDVNTVQKIRISELFADGFNNASLVKAIPFVYAYLVVGFLGATLGCFLKYAFWAILLAWLISPINQAINAGLSYGKRFVLCFYGETFAMVLTNFMAALGVSGILIDIAGVFVTLTSIMTALKTYDTNSNMRDM